MYRIINIIYEKSYYLVWIFILLYTVAAILVSVNRYWQYQTFYFDFGIYDSAIWKVSRFQIPTVDHVDIGNKNIVIFGDHFSPSVFILSPLYWLTDRREIIFVAQVLAVVAASLIGFIISSRYLKNKLATLALVIAFLGYVGTQNALISDFHEATIAVLPLMLIFWAIFSKRWKLYFLFLIIFLGFKESFAGIGVAIGLYLVVKDRSNLKIALMTAVISLLWGIVTTKYIIPYFSSIYLYTPRYLPSSLNELVLRFIFPDLHWKTIFYTYLTFGFLPIFDLAILPAVFENFFERFVLSQRGADLGMHYNAPLVPFMFIGALYAFKLMEKRFDKKIISAYATLIICMAFFLHRFVLHGPLGLSYNKVFYEQNDRTKYVDEFVANFPKSGLIMTQNDLAVRLTHQNVKLLRRNYREFNPDYIILNLTPGQNPNSFFPLSYKEVESLKDDLMIDPRYNLRKFTDYLYLFYKL